MNGASYDSSGEDPDDFGASHDSSGEDYDDFVLDNLLSSLEVTPTPRISNVDEQDMDPDWDDEGMDPDWDDEHLDPDVSYGKADDSFYVFRGHADEVYSMACSPLDKYLVATGGKDNKVFLWKFGLQDSKLEVQGHEDTISTVAFSRDGKFLASGNFDGLIKIWDAQLGIIKCTLEGSGGVEWLKWHPGLGGHLLLAGSTDCSVRLWDADKGIHLRTFNGHASGVTCGDFSGDGKIICTGSNDASLRIWDPETAESINVRDSHPYHTGGLTCLSINNDSTIAVTGSNDSTVRLVNLSSGEVIRSYYSHSDSVVCCGFARNTPYTFATGSLDSKLIVWDTLYPAPVCICEHKTGEKAEGVTCLLWLAFRPCIITGSTHGRVRMWNCVYGTCLRTYDVHRGEIVSLSMVKYCTHIASISRDRTARVFQMK
ncbi:hypothetical protein KSP39_PZI011108 [Platanthera zijinensis]|uniref:Angio-associated migratory cell protein n=1 Tax=Platanthera zijinensis TaxID=2320716 RepID=A0AAP0BH20_9ASPA